MKKHYKKYILLMIKKTGDENTLRQVYVYVDNSLKESSVSVK